MRILVLVGVVLVVLIAGVIMFSSDTGQEYRLPSYEEGVFLKAASLLQTPYLENQNVFPNGSSARILIEVENVQLIPAYQLPQSSALPFAGVYRSCSSSIRIEEQIFESERSHWCDLAPVSMHLHIMSEKQNIDRQDSTRIEVTHLLEHQVLFSVYLFPRGTSQSDVFGTIERRLRSSMQDLIIREQNLNGILILHARKQFAEESAVYYRAHLLKEGSNVLIIREFASEPFDTSLSFVRTLSSREDRAQYVSIRQRRIPLA